MTSANNYSQKQPTFAMLPPVSQVLSSCSSNPSSDASESTSAKDSLDAAVSSANRGLISTRDAISGATKQATSFVGGWLPTMTPFTRKYTLPDKTTASQVLMFRQLLHTSCKPGLRLSRKFEGTVAQRTVMHMPWWEGGVEESGRMVISYDNLVTRLWMSGAISPYVPGGIACPTDDEMGDYSTCEKTKVETFCDEKGLPPIPHKWWVERLGFQQEDPLTDFRSGGVLSLAMLLHIVEACPKVHRRFLDQGDAKVLPYAITSINVTDMLARFLMFSKSVDKIDALLSQKPFWRMFADPNALLALQEISMDILCDIVCELRREFDDAGESRDVTVFDFSTIMERTEKKVRDELLGAGPRTVDELRSVSERIRHKFVLDMERKEKIAQRKYEKSIKKNQRIPASSNKLSGNGMNIFNNRSNTKQAATSSDIPSFYSNIISTDFATKKMDTKADKDIAHESNSDEESDWVTAKKNTPVTPDLLG